MKFLIIISIVFSFNQSFGQGIKLYPNGDESGNNEILAYESKFLNVCKIEEPSNCKSRIIHSKFYFYLYKSGANIMYVNYIDENRMHFNISNHSKKDNVYTIDAKNHFTHENVNFVIDLNTQNVYYYKVDSPEFMVFKIFKK